MNAIVALCHFCETHGPCAIFCTQTLRDTKIEDVTFDHPQPHNNCPACNSIGIATAITSHDDESRASFISTEIPVLPQVATLIKQASVRSLSCEISSNKDGDFVFFGDASRGHVLSHTFHINDVQARGFYQLFSIIILMKDKYFLLNIQLFLSESLKKISKELQTYAQKVYDQEQLKESARERRLSGTQPLATVPRSLIELTAESNIFPILHSHFTWILLAGSRYLTEHLTFDQLPWMPPPSKVNNNNEMYSTQHEELALNFDQDEVDEQCPQARYIRYLKDTLDNNFISLCYCILIGIKVIFRGPLEKCNALAMSILTILPKEMHKILKLNSPDSISDSATKIITVASEDAVPVSSSSIFRVDLLEDQNDKITIRWTGQLPNKWPTLLQKIIKGIDETLFTDLVLMKHINALQEEWKNKIICLNRLKSSSDVKLKKVLGIQAQDAALISYWSSHIH